MSKAFTPQVRRAAAAGAASLALALAACGARAPLPPAVSTWDQAPADQQAFVRAMGPRGAGPAVVAVLALNEGTELTDFLVPHAVLQRAGVAQVHAVAPRGGTVTLFPALAVDGVQPLADFDARHPAGADLVVVPAMVRDDDPRIAAWLQRQARLGAKVIGICAGARVLQHAGLLDGRRHTGHWFDRTHLARTGGPFVPHRRYLADGAVATTTGVSASLPASLALVEALGGPARARSLADELGVADWSPRHDSAPFTLTTARGIDYLWTWLTPWRREAVQVDLQEGDDDIALALAADAWARTGRVALSAASAPQRASVRLRSGLTVPTVPPDPLRARVPRDPHIRPALQLDASLQQIGERLGASQRDAVALEMEHPAR